MKHLIFAVVSTLIALNAFAAAPQVTSYTQSGFGKITRTVVESEKRVCYTATAVNGTVKIDCLPYSIVEGQPPVQKTLADLPYGKLTVVKDTDFQVTCYIAAIEGIDMKCSMPLRAFIGPARKPQQ